MKKYTPKTKEWFMNRMKKKIYRNDLHCKDCATCKDVAENGIIVSDEQHAEYLAMIDSDFGAEGIMSNYRDIK